MNPQYFHLSLSIKFYSVNFVTIKNCTFKKVDLTSVARLYDVIYNLKCWKFSKVTKNNVLICNR